MSALKQIFVRVHYRYDRDSYAEDLERFAAWLLEAGYANKPARAHLFRVQQALNHIGSPSDTTLAVELLERAFRRLGRRRPVLYQHTFSTYSRFLRAVGRLIERAPPSTDPLTLLVGDFADRLVRRRGLARSTVSGYRFWISDFLKRMLTPDRSLRDLPSTSLEFYIQARASGLAPHTLRTGLKCIQAFLVYCHERGDLPERLDQIDLPRGFRDDQPPRAMAWPLVERLLDSIEPSVHEGRRDHAILHLMAYYGLRPGELAYLTLDSVNWGARTLTVCQPKTRSTLVLPLHDRTLTVLSDYLRIARPGTSLPWLFIRAKAPLGPMSKYALSFIFKTRARRSGLPIAHHSSYCLRHAFALRLFHRGVGMKAIGDLMGHHNLVSTSVYIRLQTDVLREVALPVPAQRFTAAGVA
jgi:integrase/recombinase XerD